MASDPTTDYGLPFSNYDPDGVIDPTTECDASYFEKLAVDTAAMTHVMPKAVIIVEIVSGPDADIYDYRSVWGDAVEVFPVVLYNSTGDITVTWSPSGYPDLNPTPSRQVTIAPAFYAAHVQADGNKRTPTVTVTPNSVNVKTFDAAGAAEDQQFTLWVY